ncbi:MAG TPA: DUF2934 domain-containing protein [Anaeromyxobacteraceae bacterium]|nr:DUF2934 domain-containing protein [Anaeromyxobacteraceae bacterium]
MAAAKNQVAGPKTGTARPKAAAPPAGGAATREKIAERAYQIWQENGRPEGQAEDHWFQAERELGVAQTVFRTAHR